MHHTTGGALFVVDSNLDIESIVHSGRIQLSLEEYHLLIIAVLVFLAALSAPIVLTMAQSWSHLNLLSMSKIVVSVEMLLNTLVE